MDLVLTKIVWVNTQGQFLNSLKHGQGIYYLSDGSKFVSDFKNDESTGPGIRT